MYTYLILTIVVDANYLAIGSAPNLGMLVVDKNWLVWHFVVVASYNMVSWLVLFSCQVAMYAYLKDRPRMYIGIQYLSNMYNDALLNTPWHYTMCLQCIHQSNSPFDKFASFSPFITYS